jgi:hypothetical protein
MKPLVSGAEAKRYMQPETETYLLFPYRMDQEGVRLIPAGEMAAEYPGAWAYLRSWEQELRARENGAFDDDQWWRFGRHQNLDKQEIAKLIVAQTVPSLRVCADPAGGFYINNVRVNGIVPADRPSLWYLLGVLNSDTADFVFRRIAKPKGGGYFEANRQFIALCPFRMRLNGTGARLGAGPSDYRSGTLADATFSPTSRGGCRPFAPAPGRTNSLDERRAGGTGSG